MTEEPSADQPLPESLLEGGLAAHFRSPPEEGGSERSVLKAIEARGGCAPRILLRDVCSGEDGTPLVDSHLPRPDAGDRVQVLGEIARGGMGVVLKGRDPDLGRDLAMKVLREELGEDPEIFQRFIEEAQIGGQLQHPGIVPIYGLGLLADERPYFTMKLVEGRTLSELLTGRASVAEDRPRFLSIFERICQAMAYTHARGVVHRDLKPSNIMIGPFGETQIVDWGLAKVLPRGGVDDERAEVVSRDGRVETVRHRPGSRGLESSAGTIMGTPAYMSPEQARGETLALDERSDVFSLGAILCTILTGEPPFPGESGSARRLAAEARLEEVCERLGASEADAELVELCLACLSADKVDRPRTAGILARRMSEYLASVEQRAHDAQIAAAETRVRAREEKKLIVGLAAAVLVVALAGGGVYLWLEQQTRDRLAKTDNAVAEALDEATRLSGRAESTDDPERWREALLAAQAVRLVLEAREASPELDERARLTLDRIQREEAAARERAERTARNRDLLERLREIRVPESGLQYGTDWAAVTDQYQEAFTSADLDLEGTSIDEAAARIRTSGLVVELAAALDEWAAACRAANRPEEAKRLMSIALDVDEDPTRRSLRELIVRGDSGELAEFAGATDPEEFPLATRLLFANSLGHAGQSGKAVAILEIAQRRAPDDFAVNVQLARWLSVLPEPPWTEVVGFYKAALALRPESVEVRHALGLTYETNLGEHERALELFRETARRRPDDAHLLYHVASSLSNLGRHEEAITFFRESLSRDPDFVDARCNLAGSLSNLGELGRSAELLREVIRIDPDHRESRYNLGIALRDLGDREGAILAFREALRIDPEWGQASYMLGIQLEKRGDLEGAIGAFREAVRCAPDYHWAHISLGYASSREGDREGAVSAMREAVRLEPREAEGQRGLARALAAVGDLDEAVAAYHEALRLQPDLEHLQYQLGTDLLMSGRYEEAAVALREATRLSPDHAEAVCNYGLALLRISGRCSEALEVLRRGHELGSANPDWSNPSEYWIQEAERRTACDLELLALEGGDEPPDDAERLLSLATLARTWKRHAVAAKLYALTFEHEATESQSIEANRLEAVHSAVSAAAGESAREPAATIWRELAVGWFEEELHAAVETIGTGTAVERAEAFQLVDSWLTDPELATVREPRSLARLPVGEREPWLVFWNEVRRVLASRD